MHIEYKDNYEGLGGWLFWVGLGILITTLLEIYSLSCIFKPILTTGLWKVLTTPGNVVYNSYWVPVLFEGTFCTGLVLSSFYLIYLFFSKSKSFPKWYIFLSILVLIEIFLDALALKIVAPNDQLFDKDTADAMARSFGRCLIWIPYMLRSKRVKATFVK